MRRPGRHSHTVAVLTFMGLFVLIVGCDATNSASNPKASPQQPAVNDVDVRLQVVKLKEFEEALAKHKGKVVVVDFWATYCVPCRKEFHRLVEMHEKYGNEGLVCISMTVDSPDAQEEALEFLKKQHAGFENFLIDEKPRGSTGWADRWGFDNPPAVHVYGRDGKLLRKFVIDGQESFEHSEVEPFVQKQLRGDQ
jgi:thiol-disulfide isomerase/thioredoxin